MGIRGSYIMVPDTELTQVLNGEKGLFYMEKVDAQALDIDKTYQPIHYLFCRGVENGDPPGGYVVPLRDENEVENEASDMVSYGLTAQQVREASDFLNTFDDDTLKSMYDFKEMRANKVYPLLEDVPDSEAEDFYEYIYSYLVEIREYFNQAVEKGMAILFWLC